MREENNRMRSLIEDEGDNTVHVNDASMDYLVDDMESTISLDRMLELCKFKTTKDYVANGSSFILPNGDFVSVKDNVPSKVKTRIHRDLAYQIALKVLPEVIKTRNPDSEIDFSELSEEDCRGLMARLTDAYGFCRINSGTGEREDRFYMILPPYEKKITAAQYGSILKYLDWGVENGKRWVQIYIGDEDGDEYGTFSFSKSTPDEIVKALRMGYNRGKVLFYESIHAANEDMNQEDKARFEKRIGTPYDTAKGIVENQVRGILEENGLDDIDITGFEFTGSYVFGTPREDSDLDVRMTYSGHEREDTLFNVLHDDDYPIMLNGITVDVNPIQDGDIDKLIDKDRTYKKGLNEGAKGKIIAYHGTSSRFDEFNMPINWFSESKAYSEEFARWLGNGKAFLYECELDPKSVLDVGSTDVPLFSLMPLLPPYKLSRPASSICSKLGVDEGEFAELADHTSAGNDIRKQYRLKLHAVIRLPQFAAMAKKAGFDAIRALEAGNVCYGMIGGENIRIMNVENLNESLGEAYKTPNKLYSINNGKATWDNDAQNFIWWDSESKSEPKYASSYKCKMSPKDFLDLTTDRGADALMNGDTFGIGGKFRDLDVDEFNRENRQPIFLIISFEESLIRTSPDFYRGRFEADVVGHEGRHRMYALMKAGVKEVDVQLKVADTMYFDRMKPYKISKLDLIGQFNHRVKVTVNNPIAMSWNSHRELNHNVENEIIEARKPGVHGACIRKSKLTESKEDRKKFIDKFGQDMLDLFAKSKDRLKNAGISTDMLWHVKNTDTDKMKAILYNLRAKVKTDAEGDVDPTKIQGEYKYLGSKDGYDVYEPLDALASMNLGVGTGWCTTGRYGHAGDFNFKPSYEDAKKHWDEYTEKDIRLFYFLQNGIGKWALALYPYEVEREIIVGDNYYINHCDFELYNQQDYVDYDGLLEIPFDLIEDEMTSQIIVMHDGLAIGDTIGDNYEDKKTLFHCIEDLTTVTIPTDVEVIASGAFIDCRLLKLVTIPDSVKEIGDFAFAGCDNLKSVVIPDSVTEIDTLIFYKCSKKLVVSTNNKLAINYCKENGIATKPLTAAEEPLQEGGKSMADDNRKILRGASVMHADKNALAESKADQQKFIDKFGKDIFDLFNKSKDRLKNAGISTDILYHVKNTSPEDMKNILNNLRAKVVRNGDDVDLTKIQGKYNYLGSKDGYDVYEPLDVIASMSLGVGTGWCTTGRYGHAGDLNFKPSYEDAKEHWDDYVSNGTRFFYFLKNGIGKWALALTPYESKYVGMFADMNTYIDRCNFELYNQEDTLDYDGLSKIPYDLVGLELEIDKKDTINGLVISDDGKTVLRCYYKVKTVIVPDGVATIDYGSFSHCRQLLSVTLPNSLIKIDEIAFHDCESLKSITIPKNVTEIGDEAFSLCKSLESVTILNDSTISLGECIFAYTPDNIVMKTNNKTIIEYCKENEIITKPLTASEESLQEGGKSMEDGNRVEASIAGTSIEDFDSLVSQGEGIREDIEKHDELNPKLWDESSNLKPEVREKILEIAKEFTDGLKEDGIKFDLKDIRLVGSNCSYNYTDKSDLDVHLIMDTDSLECPDDLYPLLYSAYRSLFNGKLDIDFYGIPVELYVETE